MTIQGADLVAVFSGGFLEQITTPTAPTVSATMTALDEEMLEEVMEIIDEFGKIVTFWVYASESYDPTTGKVTTSDATEYNKKVLPPYEVELKYVDGDLIQVGDLITGVAAADIEFTPVKGLKVTIDNSIWVIMRFSPIYSGERICLYIIQLRK